MRSRKRILICAAVIFLTAAGIIVLMFISKNTDNKYISEKLELAQKYLLELDYSNAVLEFTDAIKIDPKNPDAYIGLAEAYIGTGDTDKAVSALKKGLSETEDERIEQLLEKYATLENSKVTEAVTSEETSAVTADSTTTVTVSELSSLTITEAETEETVTESEEVMSISEISENKLTEGKSRPMYYAEDFLGMKFKDVSEIFGVGEISGYNGGLGYYYKNYKFEAKAYLKYWDEFTDLDGNIDDNWNIGLVMTWNADIPANKDLYIGMPIREAAKVCGMSENDITELDTDLGFHLEVTGKYPYDVLISTTYSESLDEPVSSIYLIETDYYDGSEQ